MTFFPIGFEDFLANPPLLVRGLGGDNIFLTLPEPTIGSPDVIEFLFSVGLPVANAPDVLQPCDLFYYP